MTTTDRHPATDTVEFTVAEVGELVPFPRQAPELHRHATSAAHAESHGIVTRALTVRPDEKTVSAT